ncbi:CopD family protein [Thioalkalivibrio sp. ALJ24]|uniref:CopD family protein n=1 Tax=Thioalkalivibrio sp. ALJ24 TaxID=545276 RepID=UPI00035C956C|nr:CopD family protein [Thioalkalivibrio sp. ALJ24]
MHEAYSWFLSLHLIFMVTWFAGLFYLPRLFVYHATTDDAPGNERFKVMERKLFYGIMTPGGILTVIFGGIMLALVPAHLEQPWMHFKLTLLALLIAYHLWCGKLVADFAADRNIRSHYWYRWFNELPVPVLVGVVILAINRSITDALIGIGVILLLFAVSAAVAWRRARGNTG